MKYRTQNDGLADEVSRETAVFFAGPDLTRQEFAADADAETFVKRYGVPAAPQFGEQTAFDFDLHLQDAKLVVQETREAFLRLPDAIRARYPSWYLVMEAAAVGEVIIGPDGPVLKAEAAKPSPDQPTG